MIYLDNSATTRPFDEVREAMRELEGDFYGNPSSLHRMGLNAEKKIKEAREKLAGVLLCKPSELYFTSGGTESDNTALFGAAFSARRSSRRIISTEVEHPAVLEALERLKDFGFTVTLLSVDSEGRVSVRDLEEALSEDTALVSVMGVNNETGAVMPVEEIAARVAEYNRAHGCRILMHSDMVQGFCKLRLELKNIDLVSIAAHKIHGPKGVGALYKKEGVHISPFMYGGGQEGGLRSGTENTSGIYGLALAAELLGGSMKQNEEKLAGLREGLKSILMDGLPDIRINGPEDTRRGIAERTLCPSVLNVSFLGTRGEVLLHSLESEGVFVSTGSACSSNHKNSKGSHVLRAMGLNAKEIEGAIRFSFSPLNSLAEIEEAGEKTVNAVRRFRRLGSFR